jgi:hypothetical protein
MNVLTSFELNGAGYRNRTGATTLEGSCTTIIRIPQGVILL